MTYNPNVPMAPDLLSVSQSDLLVNFQQANTRFGYDHYEFDFAGGAAAPYDVAVAADKGKHRQLTCVRVSADIGNAGVDELALYNKNDAGGNQEWFMRRQSGGTIIQMTAGDPVNANPGVTFLPGGLLLKFGTVNASNGTIIVFPATPAFSATPHSVVVTPVRINGSGRSFCNVRNGTLSTAQFQINYVDQSNNSSNGDVFYMAIGTV